MRRATPGVATAGSTARPRRSPFRIPVWLGFCLFLAIALFFLWEEHRAHLLGALPFVLLLLCPLIHLFVHRGHGHAGGAHLEHGGRGQSERGLGGIP
ncbi:hypothetical protein AMOR_13990 [Anaeromyxobacter oryzae]|uniref:DUF2933 domain-containing protein n=2 Tax=Anaeromyxobacter oryzae TaxID=2918170 RepID=A0ABN6MRQ9_9BACT|nr:hypothetical protein AMOR_13990 [Anaeromyxobacter oryzae]